MIRIAITLAIFFLLTHWLTGGLDEIISNTPAYSSTTVESTP